MRSRNVITRTTESQYEKSDQPKIPEPSTKGEKSKSPPRNRNNLLIVIITLIICSFVSGSFIGNSIGYRNGYQSGFKDGEKVGNEDGQIIGYEIGYDFGKNHGYNTGYSDGNSVGYQLGVDIGRQAGYVSGFNVGNKTGYLDGFNNCWQSGFEATGYTIRDPTYKEALDFVHADQTEKIPYDIDTFNCIDFSAALKRNAFDAGYRAFFVYIDFKTTSHSVVAFNTTDEGLVFIEPQYDMVLKLEVGENYTLLNTFSYDPDLVITRYVLVL